MVEQREKEKMLRAHSIGSKMVRYLEEIGVERLSDLRGAYAGDLALRINIALGRKHMNRMGVAALQKLIDLAERDGMDEPKRETPVNPAAS